MTIKNLQRIYKRDLNKLKVEIELYRNEQVLWSIENNISNSGGNLCLHLIGNLNTFIGAELGNSNYKRDRVGEFSNSNIPKYELSNMVSETLQTVDETLNKLTDKDLSKMYSIEVFKEPMTTEFFLLHLATHLTYHLGQINYHRRILDTNENS